MNILTFDIEDWYCRDMNSHYEEWDKLEVRIYEGVDRILQSLSERNLKGTFFVLGWLADKHPQLIRKIAEEGHQIGCHTYKHDLLTSFNRHELYEDTYKAKSIIEDAIGQQIDAFRAPAFSITKDNLFAFDILGELGFTIDASVFPAYRHYGGLPMFKEAKPCIIEYNGYQFKEFPIRPAHIFGGNAVFSGGAYFRFTPYHVIKFLTRRDDYNMTYFHPNDFDPDQPAILDLSAVQQMINKISLRVAYDKYVKYLSDFDFVNIDTAVSEIDWEKVPVIRL